MVSPFLKQCFVVLGVALSLACHGAAYGHTVTLTAQYRDPRGQRMSNTDISWMGSVFSMTKILGTLSCPALMSHLGRRRTHLLTTLPAFVHWNLFTFANSLPVFIIARLLQGYAIGIHATMNSMLIAEYTDPKYRASFAAVTMISMGLGIIWVHFSGTLLDWRMTAAVCSLLPVSTAVVTWLSPETPSWLVSKERYEEARKVFLWLRGDGDDQRKEIEDLVADHKKNRKSEEDKGKKESLIENLKRIKQAASVKEFYQPLAIGISFCFIYEFGGVHYMPAYGNLILKYLLDKSDAKDVSWQLNALDILRPVSAGLAVIVLKNVKRRTIIFTSGGLTITSFISMSIYLYVRDAGVFKQSWLCDILIMSLMVLYTVAFNIGLCPIYLVILGEIIPLAYRGISSAIIVSFLSPSTFTVMKSAPYMYSALGVQGTFLVYSLILTVCLCIVYVLLPETKDRTLLDIEKGFKGRRKVEEIADVEMKLMGETRMEIHVAMLDTVNKFVTI